MRVVHAVKGRLRRLPFVARIRWRLRDARGYPLAQRYLAGLKGIEIGGAAHNPFELDTINVDVTRSEDTAFKRLESREAGWALPVDVVAPGDRLPFADKSYDFVLASHVIEHFQDPIGALIEWDRVARDFIFLVIPHPDRTFDRGRALTSVPELIDRHRRLAGRAESEPDERHHSVWTCESFVELCAAIGLEVVATEDPDRKRGNGFAVVLGMKPDRRSVTIA